MDTPRELNVKRTVIGASVLLIAFAYMLTRDLRAKGFQVLSGQTMGTTYEVKLSDFTGRRSDLRLLQFQIDERLKEINRQMSTYLPDSEISLFNKHNSWNPFKVSPELARVTRYAVDLSHSTGGAFDPTVEPLVRLWGFGATERRTAPPSDEEVAEALTRCGYKQLLRPAERQLVKSHPEIELDLSAVAKGYAVDEVVGLLQVAGQSNCYVEIGGEVRVTGFNPDGAAWRIGIDRPAADRAPGSEPIRIVQVKDLAIASSGDYRNFFEDQDGTRYSHILDPRTGRPVTNQVAATTVLASSCMEADGMATALLVMGPERGLKWVEKQKDVEALILVRTEGNGFEQHESSGFAAFAAP